MNKFFTYFFSINPTQTLPKGEGFLKAIFFSIFFCFENGFAQNFQNTLEHKNLAPKKIENNENFGFRRTNIRRASVPFQIHNNLMVISLRINFKDSLNFVVDTGAGHILLIDSLMVQQLALPKLAPIKIYATGIDEEVEGYISKVDKIDFGDIEGRNIQVVFLKNNLWAISKNVGMKIHGIMGYELFKNFIVKIRYEEKRIVFLKHRQNYHIPRKAEVFTLQMQQRKPYFVTNVFLKDKNDTLKGKFLIDTGAGHLLSLETPSNPEKIKVPEKHLKSRLGTTLNGDMVGSYAFIEQIDIGKWKIKKPIVIFPDSLSLAKIYKRQPFRNGSVGMDFLKRFYVILDYKNKKVVLKSNKAKINTELEFNTSGVDIVALPPKFDQYAVSDVRPNSPADRVYVEKGDKIISINGIVAKKDAMPLLVQLLKSKAGTKIQMVLERGTSIFDKEFVTEMPF